MKPMKFSHYSALPALALLGLGSCTPDIDAGPAASPGTADFTQYIAVGNSLTSGYSDGGLYNEAQATSYPAILAQQFGKTGKGPASFVQPSFADAQRDGSGYIKLTNAFSPTNNQLRQSPVPTQATLANMFLGEKVAFTGTTLLGGNPQLAAYTGSQPDNLGIPGISVLSSLAPTYGAANPFLERLLPAADKGTKPYLAYVAQKTPTFFTCWLGNNDVLTYATNGGVVNNIAPNTPDPLGDLTDTTRFGGGYRAILQTLSKNGTVQGVVANIPDVTAVPYFKTVPPLAAAAGVQARAVPDANKAALTAGLGLTPAQAATIRFGLFIQTGTGAVREITGTDLVLLPASSAIGSQATPTSTPLGFGVVITGLSPQQAAGLAAVAPPNPLPSKYVLDPAETAAVQARTIDLNKIIARTAAKYKLPVADMNAFFTKVAAAKSCRMP